MPTDLGQEKKQVHGLIDRLTPNQVSAVRELLEAMLNARADTGEDDEPATDADRTRFREGQAWLAQHGGKGIPMEQVLAEFGLKPEDFPVASDNA